MVAGLLLVLVLAVLAGYAALARLGRSSPPAASAVVASSGFTAGESAPTGTLDSGTVTDAPFKAVAGGDQLDPSGVGQPGTSGGGQPGTSSGGQPGTSSGGQPDPSSVGQPDPSSVGQPDPSSVGQPAASGVGPPSTSDGGQESAAAPDQTTEGTATPELPSGLLVLVGLVPLAALLVWHARRTRDSAALSDR